MESVNTTASGTPATTTPAPTGCCLPFDPATWPTADVTWKDKPFVKAHVRGFLHVPLDMERTVRRSMRFIERAGATSAQGLMLSDEGSPWGSDLYIEVTGPVPGANVVTLTGTFMTKVYEGPFRDAPKWAEDMRAYVATTNRTVKKLFFRYAACPRCAKAYGKNYVVLFADVSAP